MLNQSVICCWFAMPILKRDINNISVPINIIKIIWNLQLFLVSCENVWTTRYLIQQLIICVNYVVYIFTFFNIWNEKYLIEMVTFLIKFMYQCSIFTVILQKKKNYMIEGNWFKFQIQHTRIILNQIFWLRL